MSDQDLYAAVMADYSDGRPSLMSSNGRVIVGTDDEMSAVLPEKVISTVRVPQGMAPTMTAREWLTEGCEDPATVTERLRRFDAVVRESKALEAATQENSALKSYSLIEHARRELALRGETDQAFVDSIIAAVRGFSSYPGHSGGSTAIAVEYVHDLLRWRTLTPLTRDPAEWIDRTEISGRPMWQNNRDPRAISEDGGLTYWLTDEQSQTSDGPDAPRYTSAEPFTRQS
jgi:hypothetical protein